MTSETKVKKKAKNVEEQKKNLSSICDFFFGTQKKEKKSNSSSICDFFFEARKKSQNPWNKPPAKADATVATPATTAIATSAAAPTESSNLSTASAADVDDDDVAAVAVASSDEFDVDHGSTTDPPAAAA